MTTLSASSARIPTDVYNQVAYTSKRVRVVRRSSPPVYLVSEADLQLIEAANRVVAESTERMADKYDSVLKNLAD